MSYTLIIYDLDIHCLIYHWPAIVRFTFVRNDEGMASLNISSYLLSVIGILLYLHPGAMPDHITATCKAAGTIMNSRGYAWSKQGHSASARGRSLLSKMAQHAIE